MKDEEIRLMENLCLGSALSLEDLCHKLSKSFGLPRFEFDAENESEWGWVQVENIEINVSRPLESGTLQDWDASTPEDCNFSILLIVSNSAPVIWDVKWSLKEFVPEFAQRIANVIGSDVYHHRTWRAPGENIQRNRIYNSPANA